MVTVCRATWFLILGIHSVPYSGLVELVVLVDVEVAQMTAVVMAVPKADSFHRECSESGFEKLLSCYFKD